MFCYTYSFQTPKAWNTDNAAIEYMGNLTSLDSSKTLCTARGNTRNDRGSLGLAIHWIHKSCSTLEVTRKVEEEASTGISQGPLPVINVKEELNNPFSLATLFEVVADDLLTLNKNLQTIVGAENPLLMLATDQIFGAGGKRMRPALVFLVSRATAQLAGLKELTVKHRRLAEIIEITYFKSGT